MVFLVVRSRLVCYKPAQRIWRVIKTAETIESLTQPGLLYSGLRNYAERPSEDRSGVSVEKVADQAHAPMLAEFAVKMTGMLWQWKKEGSKLVVSTSHIGNKFSSRKRVDGAPVATAARVDEHVKAVTEDRTKPAASNPMELNETK